MGRKKIPGLRKRYGVWHIDKIVSGQRICESTDTSNLEEAEKILAHRMEKIRQAKLFGVRPKRTFVEAATKYLQENQHKASIQDEALQLKIIMPFIGKLFLEAVHMGSLQPFIKKRKADNVKNRTINYALQVTRQILNRAATEWMDEQGVTWLHAAPKIKLLKETDKRKPYPLNWEEQDRLFTQLPSHLRNMALFAVNTGCRDQVICKLRWEWEVKLDQTSVFLVPGKHVKNREDRLIVLNETAQSVVDSVRGIHPEYVFTYKNRRVTRMLNTGWKKARIKTGLFHVRVHDLKHTFGRRLRAAGVSFEDRQDLLGHKSGRITTHYSAAELENLITAANKACKRNETGLLLRLVSQSSVKGSRETHAQKLNVVNESQLTH